MTIKTDIHGNAVQACRPYSSQVVGVSGTSALSAPFSTNVNYRGYLNDVRVQGAATNVIVEPNNTQHVRVVSTVPCWLAFTKGPSDVGVVAVKLGANSMYMPAGLPEYFWVRPGSQIAVIQDAGSGNLYITELAND